MALITETGTASATSESYCSVADSLTYHADRGNTTWATITTAQQEAALRRATDFIEQVYGQAWQGITVNMTQSLSFPRSGVYINGYAFAFDAIPKCLVNATAEMALKAAAGELVADLEQGVIREKLAALEVEYDKYSPRHKVYSAVASMLKPLLRNTSSISASLVRA